LKYVRLAQCDHVTFEQGEILNALRAFKARILTRRSLLLLAGSSQAFVSSARVIRTVNLWLWPAGLL